MAVFMLRLSSLLSLEGGLPNATENQLSNITSDGEPLIASYGMGTGELANFYQRDLNREYSSSFPTTVNPSFPPVASPLVASVSTEFTTINLNGNISEVTPSSSSIEDVSKRNNPSSPAEYSSTTESQNFVVIGNLGIDEHVSKGKPVLETSDKPKLMMEEFIEEPDELSDLADRISPRNESKDNIDSFVTPSFEYYDFSAEKNSMHIPPILTARSLVSPVPYPRPKTTISYNAHPTPTTEPFEDTTTSSQTGSVTHSSSLGEPEDAVSDKTENILPVRVNVDDSSGRNNPYPYGPMFLPGYSDKSPLTGFSNKSPLSPVAGDIYRPRSNPTTTSLPLAEDYEYEYEAYDYRESIRKVQTDKPPVLFHFDGPGYAPEAPSTSAPAV